MMNREREYKGKEGIDMGNMIELDWRIYLPLIVLLTFGMMAVSRYRKPQQKRKMRSRGKGIVIGIGKIMLLVVTLLPAIIFPPYGKVKPQGPYEVATLTYTLEDPSRTDPFSTQGTKRKVNVELWYPQDAKGKYPLVVFDHGAYGVRKSNESVYLELASEGYVVCAIDHPGHSFYTKLEDGTRVMIDKGSMQPTNYQAKSAPKVLICI